MNIDLLNPDDIAAMSAWYDFTVVVSLHDKPDFPAPPRRRHMARFAYPWLGLPETVLLAREGDRIVGSAVVMTPMIDNTDTAYLELDVHPDHRRHGIGTALMHEVFALARREHRRLIELGTIITMPGGPERDNAGTEFLARFGDKPGLINVRSRWSVETALDIEAPIAAGYSLVQWRDRTPDDVVDAIAALESRLLLDAPSGDLDIEPEKIDAARVHANDATRLGLGDRMYTSAIRHDATGRVVAHTVIALDDEAPEHGWQQITIVDPEHRGHRLGLAVKVANHANVRRNEPSLRCLDTWNAEPNVHMLAVNEQLGYQAVDLWPIWQITVPTG